MNVFDEMGNYWAEIAGQSSTQNQIQFIKDTLKGNEWVLDLACGTGRHLIPLSKEGYNMVGLDVSLNLLRIVGSYPLALDRGMNRTQPFVYGA